MELLEAVSQVPLLQPAVQEGMLFVEVVPQVQKLEAVVAFLVGP